jgi:hypothetical protein
VPSLRLAFASLRSLPPPTLLLLLALAACEQSSPKPHGKPVFDASMEPGDDASSAGDGDGDGDASVPPNDAEVAQDLSALLYPGDRLVKVEIEVDAADWDLIRHEGRSLIKVYSGCGDIRGFEYTTVPGSVSVDGQRFEQVGLRKRGLLGSLSTAKPSLRVDFAEYDPQQKLHGSKVMALNNSIQDTTYVRQCLAYELFAAAKLPAPRCAFASVSVNGKSLGTYVHVEAVKKPLLARQLGENGGDLYEGSGADFLPHLLANFEKETHEDEPAGPELDAMRAALELPDDQLLAALEPLIDLDTFVRYWALESLSSTEDSYTGGQNNFFMYVSEKTRKLTFIPWGTDGAFLPPNGEPKRTANLKSTLPRRLYGIPAVRKQFRDTLRTMLDELWHEDQLVADARRMQALLGVAIDPTNLKALETFIRERRAVMAKELDGQVSVAPPAASSFHQCDASRVSEIRGEFKSVWGSVADMSPQLENTLDLKVFGHLLPPGLLMTSAGMADQRPTIMYSHVAVDAVHSLLLFLGPEARVPGVRSFHGFETFGILVSGPLVAPSVDNANQFVPYGWISDGTITLDEAEERDGAVMRGRFAAKLVRTRNEAP